MAEVMAERGAEAGSATVTDVIERAGVSSAAFHQLFADREAALLAAFDLGVAHARERMVAAYESETRWLDAIKFALAAFLMFLEEEPALGRLIVVYAMGGGAQVLHRRAVVLDEVASALRRGRPEGAAGGQPPSAVIAEGVIGGVLAILHSRLVADEQQSLWELFGALTSMIVLPYLGPGVARRELTRPAPRLRLLGDSAPQERERLAGQEFDTRLTYRTARTLSAIGDYPGASNREVAERAGVVDQGQISKLLNRLEQRELIEKIREGRSRGAPNSWRLTERGELLTRSASVRAAIGS